MSYIEAIAIMVIVWIAYRLLRAFFYRIFGVDRD